ncbi:hypothetical protein [Sinorhizobium americanum]|nr:hypothetical protein [Sinorhizobium americanum]
MIVYVSPDALRAARALARLNQREVAAKLHISRKAMTACESGEGATLAAIARLRQFYDGLGIEFLGCADFTTNKVTGAGARWKSSDSGLEQNVPHDFHGEPTCHAFAAARGLLGLDQTQVAARVYLTPRQIGNLEAGTSYTKESYKSLQTFYEDSGIEFLGSGGPDSLFWGVGVRWRKR